MEVDKTMKRFSMTISIEESTNCVLSRKVWHCGFNSVSSYESTNMEIVNP